MSVPASATSVLLSRPVQIAVVGVELLLAVWLLVGIYAREARMAASGLFLAFAGYACWRLVAGAGSCGCFGAVDVPPAVMLALDLLVVTALFGCPSTDAITKTGPLRWTMALTAALVVPTTAAIFADRPVGPDGMAADGLVVLKPETWTGRPFPLLEHVAIPASLDSGRWTVVLYRHDCADCLRDLPRHEALAKRLAEERSGHRVALVSVPPHAGGADPSTAAVRGRLDQRRDWFVSVPAVVELRAGIVVDPSDNDIPSDIPAGGDR